MKPIEFPEVNHTYAKDQPEYQPLPVMMKSITNSDHVNGEVVSCWKLTWKEKLQILFTGKIWLSVWTFNKALQPLRPSVYKSDLISKDESKAVK